MIDSWDFPEGDFSEEFRDGLGVGYLQGVREWEALLPGITVPRMRESTPRPGA